MSVYQHYKPLRNYLRQFSYLESLNFIWLYSEHLAHKLPLPVSQQFKNEYGLARNMKETLFPWEAELICREVVLNAETAGNQSLGNWRGLSTVINHVRRIENDTSQERDLDRTIMRELHRIVHRQFPWQRPPGVNSMMRYYKIFGSGEMNAILERETGLTMKKFFALGLVAAGHFMKKPGMSIAQDYTAFGISTAESLSFYSRLTSTSAELKEATRAVQRYDSSWAYSFNPLAARPLVSFDREHPERVLCPIPTYLLRRITDGVFYDLANAAGFDNAFGHSFQDYVGEILRVACPTPRFELVAEQEYQVGKYRKDGVDWILTDDSANLFVECKTKRLRHDAKFLDDATGLEAALETMAGYIVQHYKNICDAIQGKTTWRPNGKPGVPIIITLEDWWLFNPEIIGALDRQVESQMEKARLPLSMLSTMPFTVASVDEFELAAQVVEKTGILRFFGQKSGPERRQWAISPFALGDFPDEVKAIKRRLFADDFIKIGEELHPQRV